MSSDDIPFATCFEFEKRVEFSETDLAGIVHFSNFYRYMEAAEHAFFRSLGHSIHEEHDGQMIGWPRVQSSCEFFKPARFENVVKIRICIDEVRSRSLRCRYRFCDESGTAALAEGRMSTVCVSIDTASGKIEATLIPQLLKEKLEEAKRNASIEA